MKVGLIARCNDRGLGVMTREWYRHVHPDRTLVMLLTAERQAGLAQHRDWYPDGTFVEFDGHTVDQKVVREWLDGLDVVYSAETFYDWRIVDWAHTHQVRTVCHLMPEYFAHASRPLPSPDVWWAPTTWRLEHLPPDTRVMPVPVPTDRWPDARPEMDGPPRWIHTAGAAAPSDRNGTRIVYEALRYLNCECAVTIRRQDEMSSWPQLGRHVHLELHTRAVVNYWELFGGQDGLVLPRRYGGLSLPAIEAMGAGLALLMPEVEPQRSEWPIAPLRATMQNHVSASGGRIPMCVVDPKHLAATMDAFAENPEALLSARRDALVWAHAHSWDVLHGDVLRALEDACR
jgi:hypothetical protein